MSERNIVLLGFMGAGKTSVGREVARRMGRDFVDLDELIAARAGKSVPDIFADDGEAAFREMETGLCREMAAESGYVIAAGGGAVLNPGNRQALSAGGIVICLDARPETLVQRLDGNRDRPLLAGNDRLERVKSLMAERAGAYGAILHHIDTEGLTVAATADKVIALATRVAAERSPATQETRVIPVRGEYNIVIAPGALASVGDLLGREGIKYRRCAVITNPTVASYHLAGLQQALSASGIEPVIMQVPDGEAYKNLHTVGDLYTRLAEARLARDEAVLALGGGVIGDMAGFVAATWLRGVPFVQIPTTLLAMVDASVGGKVAVDLEQGKNLVGAFKQPALVLIDPALLATLPDVEYRAGLAEVLKHGLIGDPPLFDELLSHGAPAQTAPAEILAAMLARAIEVKVAIVERDPYENAERAWLNLGHTFAHALELLSGFTLRHGEAVGLGMIAAAELSKTLGYCDPDLPPRVRDAVTRLGLSDRWAFESKPALEAMANDKKRRAGSLRFVVIRRPGEVGIADGVSEEAVFAALETIRADPDRT